MILKEIKDCLVDKELYCSFNEFEFLSGGEVEVGHCEIKDVEVTPDGTRIVILDEEGEEDHILDDNRWLSERDDGVLIHQESMS